jgi:hypothetical protein
MKLCLGNRPETIRQIDQFVSLFFDTLHLAMPLPSALKRRLGALSPTTRAIIRWAGRSLWTHLLSVTPISLLFILYIVVIFQQPIEDIGSIIAGIIAALIGLCMFIEGLRLSLMVRSAVYASV